MIYESINIPVSRALKDLRGKRILDVGCGTGALGELLTRNENVVEGVTFQHEEARIAATRMSKVHQLDLNDLRAVEASIGGSFDVLVLAGVLEHLVDPVETLRVLLRKLVPGGIAYVSLPNIACFYIRVGLLFGRFNTSRTGGILDETHLHHYTHDTARAMLAEAGLTVHRLDHMPGLSVWFYTTFLKNNEVVAIDEQPRIADRADFNFYVRYIYDIEHFLTSFWRTMFANELVYTCTPHHAPLTGAGTRR